MESYLAKVDLAHPIWYHLRLAPLLWHYLYGPSAPFPISPSPISTPEDPYPLVPPLPPLLRCRSLHTLLEDMRADGSLLPGEELPSDESIVRYCQNRHIITSSTGMTRCLPRSIVSTPLGGRFTWRRILLVSPACLARRTRRPRNPALQFLTCLLLICLLMMLIVHPCRLLQTGFLKPLPHYLAPL